MTPIIITPEDEVIIPDLDAGEIDVKFDPTKGKPGDWKQSSKWKDNYYCDVEKVTNYVAISEPTEFWAGYLERADCYAWCQKNMVEFSADCCGQSWLFEDEKPETQSYCALYQASGFKNMPAEDKNDGMTMFYSATIVNPDYLDEIMGYGEQAANYIEGALANRTLDLSNTVVNV